MKTQKIILNAGFWAMFAAMQMLSISHLVGADFVQIFVFAGILTAALAFVNFAAGVFFRYANVIHTADFQEIVNVFALAVVSLILVLGLSYGSIFLFFNENIFINFLKILPVEILIFLLIFALIIFYNKLKIINIEKEEIPVQEIAAQPVKREKITQITVREGSQVHIILLNEILYLQADGDYVQIRTAERRHLKEQTMKFFEECLPADVFVRVHRSYIVNIQQIARIEKFGKDTQTLTLKNGEKSAQALPATAY